MDDFAVCLFLIGFAELRGIGWVVLLEGAFWAEKVGVEGMKWPKKSELGGFSAVQLFPVYPIPPFFNNNKMS